MMNFDFKKDGLLMLHIEIWIIIPPRRKKRAQKWVKKVETFQYCIKILHCSWGKGLKSPDFKGIAIVC
jgi:hypothetical protein